MKSTELYFEKALRFLAPWRLRGEIFTAKACLPAKAGGETCLPDRQAQSSAERNKDSSVLTSDTPPKKESVIL